MGCYTWWLSIAICFTALAALQVNGNPELLEEQFDANDNPERPEEQFDDFTPKTPTMPPFDETTSGIPTITQMDETTSDNPPLTQMDETTSGIPTITQMDETTSDSPPLTQMDGDDMESDYKDDDEAHAEREKAPEGDDMESDYKDDDEAHAEREKAPEPRDFLASNPTVIGGQPVFEGDIAMTESQWRGIRERKAIRSLIYRWDKGPDGCPRVPYIFADRYVSRTAVLAGIKHWMERTCIKFEQTTNTSQPHLKFIRSSGCWSYIGKLNQNGQYVSIGFGCTTLGIVAHEIGHALGFYHEQSRPDRDSYVYINYANILPGRQHNFNKYSTGTINTYGIPYDYSSVMHYPDWAFTRNGRSTIVARYPFGQTIMGQRAGLSHRDVHLANLMYDCIAKWLVKCNMTSDPCLNGGFLGSNCRCVCPPGTLGARCEAKPGCYYDEVRNFCTRRITTGGIIQSPGFPIRSTRVPCVLWIVAPRCYLPRVTFYWFQMNGKSNCYGTPCCYYEFMEIFTGNSLIGSRYCDREIPRYRTFTSTTNQMVLHYKTISFYSGFYAYVYFSRQAGCT